MAADLSGGAPDPWSWSNVVGAAGAVLAAIGLPGLLVSLASHFSGRHKTEAEAEKAEAEAEQIRDRQGAEFQRALNDAMRATAESWEKQVTHLIEMTRNQSERIASLEAEVVALRQALDAATRELHARGQRFGQ